MKKLVSNDEALLWELVVSKSKAVWIALYLKTECVIFRAVSPSAAKD
jgi:hypothetical protein